MKGMILLPNAFWQDSLQKFFRSLSVTLKESSALTSMKRQLKPEEHEEIVKAIAAGDRVKAKSIYLSATEGNLTEAQNFIKALVESEAAEARSAGAR
jgi:DNA-binding FadR family transcriptional regulator